MMASETRNRTDEAAEELAVFDEPLEQALGAVAELCAGMADDASLHERVRARADTARGELEQARGEWFALKARCGELEAETRRLGTELQRLQTMLGAIARTLEDEEWPSGV